MNGLKMMKNKAVKFFAAEAHGAVEMLKHLSLQLYWSAILAVVLQYSEGTLGDIKGFAGYTVGLRLLKMPFELQLTLKSEVLWYLYEILQKIELHGEEADEGKLFFWRYHQTGTCRR